MQDIPSDYYYSQFEDLQGLDLILISLNMFADPISKQTSCLEAWLIETRSTHLERGNILSPSTLHPPPFSFSLHPLTPFCSH